MRSLFWFLRHCGGEEPIIKQLMNYFNSYNYLYGNYPIWFSTRTGTILVGSISLIVQY